MRWALLVSGQCYNGALADYPARGPEQPRASVRARGHDAASCETQRGDVRRDAGGGQGPWWALAKLLRMCAGGATHKRLHTLFLQCSDVVGRAGAFGGKKV